MILSNKQMLRMAIPVFIEQALLQMMNALNLIFISKAGASAVSGVSVVDQITVFTYCVFSIAGIGCSVVIAQLTGQGDTEGVKKTVRQAVFLGVCAALAAIVMGMLGNRMIISLLLGKAEESVIQDASRYFFLNAVSYPFYMLYTVLIFALRGRGEMRATMFTTLMQSIMNAILAYFFVSVLHLGVLGAGLAIIVARVTGAGCGTVLAIKAGILDGIKRLLPKKPDRNIIKNIVRLGLPNGIESMILSTVKISIMMLVVKSGTAQMAAIGPSQIGIDMCALLPLTLTYILPTCIGFAKSSAEQADLKKYANRLLVFGFFISLLSHGIVCFFAAPYANLFGLPAETTATIIRIIRIAVWAQGVTWAFTYVIPSMIRGAGDVIFTSVCSAVVIIAVRYPVSYYFCEILNLGAYGLYLAMFVDFAVKGGINIIYYLTGKWTEKKKITAA